MHLQFLWTKRTENIQAVIFVFTKRYRMIKAFSRSDELKPRKITLSADQVKRQRMCRSFRFHHRKWKKGFYRS